MSATLALIDTWDAATQSWAAALGWPLEGVLRLAVASILGGLIGLEREIQGRQAGFRTNMLVCLGSALVMIVSIQFAQFPWKGPPGVTIAVDPARIAYGVMTGIGFLGAGTILHYRGAVQGLTTAAGIWCVAALGLAVGFGMYLLAVLAFILILLALWVFDYIELLLPAMNTRTITVRTAFRPGCVREAAELFQKAGMHVLDSSMERVGDLSVADVHIRAAFRRQEQFGELERRLIEDSRFELMASRVQ